MVQGFLNEKNTGKNTGLDIRGFFFFFEMLRWLAILKEQIEVWQRWLLSQAKKRTWLGFRHKENNISEIQIAKNYTPDWARRAPTHSQAASVPSSQRITTAELVFPVSLPQCGGKRWSGARARCLSRGRVAGVPGAGRREPSGPNAVNKPAQVGCGGVH